MMKIFCIPRLLLLCAFVLHGSSDEECEGSIRELPLHDVIGEHDAISPPPTAEQVPSTDVGLICDGKELSEDWREILSLRCSELFEASAKEKELVSARRRNKSALMELKKQLREEAGKPTDLQSHEILTSLPQVIKDVAAASKKPTRGGVMAILKATSLDVEKAKEKEQIRINKRAASKAKYKRKAKNPEERLDRFVALGVLLRAQKAKKQVEPSLISAIEQKLLSKKRVSLHEISDLLLQKIKENDGSTEEAVLQEALKADWKRRWRVKGEIKIPLRFAALGVLLRAEEGGRQVDPLLISELEDKLMRAQQIKSSCNLKVRRPVEVNSVGLHEISDLLRQRIRENDGRTEMEVLQEALKADDDWVQLYSLKQSNAYVKRRGIQGGSALTVGMEMDADKAVEALLLLKSAVVLGTEQSRADLEVGMKEDVSRDAEVLFS
ncbi:MAG: hypothetical protein OXC30_02315, partial [Alphaproteobacteria bacterium]|nr:hypothetical protein [Alphaproteobacteria bacterium]